MSFNDYIENKKGVRRINNFFAIFFILWLMILITYVIIYVLHVKPDIPEGAASFVNAVALLLGGGLITLVGKQIMYLWTRHKENDND